MRVMIDATSLLLRSAGIKNYTWFWIQHLRRQAEVEERIDAFPWLWNVGGLDHERSVLARWETLPRLAMLYFVNIPGNPALTWLSDGTDVFHASNQVHNPPRQSKLTATVHDLTCWLMPELHTEANVRADASFAERVFRRADGLIAVSENTRQDAMRLLGIAPEKIRTIHSGVADVFFDAVPTPRAKPYVLFVGTIEPRKNLDGLLDAWLAMKPSLREEYDLLIAGPVGWAAGKTVDRLRSGLESVHVIGYVPEQALPGLTAGACVFAYPSLYEGFGFPAAQAMAAGVPVLTANTSCLPEVTGEGALHVDPRSQSELTLALELLLTSQSLREKLSRKGRERAAGYRWKQCAEESLEFFRDVAGK